MSLHPLGFDLASVGVFVALSLGSAVTVHWMDCSSQKSYLGAVKPAVNPCAVSVCLGAEWADVWGGMKGREHRWRATGVGSLERIASCLMGRICQASGCESPSLFGVGGGS